MIVVAVKYRIHAADEAGFRESFVWSQERASAEPGCISYRFYQDIVEPERFFLFEEWESQAALDVHLQALKGYAAAGAPKRPEAAEPPSVIKYVVSSAGSLF